VSAYRVGGGWGVTIVREGVLPTDASGYRRDDDELVAVVTNGDRALAERICELLNSPSGDCPACGHTVVNHITSGCIVLVDGTRCYCRAVRP